jgi:hypothetical protein
MRGDRRPLPLTATTRDELEALSRTLHDWWIADATVRSSEQELVLQLEAEGLSCGPDDWQTSRTFGSGAQEWEAPPATYGAELIFKDVIGASVADPARIGNYTISEIGHEDGTLTLRAEPEFTMTLRVGAIDVIARDRD